MIFKKRTIEMPQKQQPNRLIHESSPYLLQHAYNPVDWYPWGREAFEKAQKEDKPVFLSIGYSTCHWCHVMAHESFEDYQIASVLNEYFVPVKVDREERPDVDSIYMDVVQAVTGSGGWPLSVFLTPQKKPFYCGTYFPAADIGGRLSFYKVLMSIHEAWIGRYEDLLRSSEQITSRVSRLLYHKTEGEISKDILQKAYESLKQAFDEECGGFGLAPKFPAPSTLSFLLVYYYRTGQPQALDMVERTLQRMASGGIYDHLGGGFHRYAVDRNWLVPHFEKMLYDQAQLAHVYLKACQITGKEYYARTAKDIFHYVFRDMMDPAGGFYSAQDADSEGHEGRFYLWDFDEVITAMGQEKGRIFAACHGIHPQGILEGKNILHLEGSIEEISANAGLSTQAVEEIIREGHDVLLQLRSNRIHPNRDEKIITAWNGLMISSLAAGGAILGEPQYIRAAERTADFILQNLFVQNRLRRCYTKGKAGEPAFLEDYAFLIQGLLDLYESGFNPVRLSEAIDLAEQMIDLFEDSRLGGFFLYGNDAEELIVRPKSAFDGAVPSGNSAAALALMRLGTLTGKNEYFEHGWKTVRLFSKAMQTQAMAMTGMLMAADFAFGPRREVVIAGSQRNQNTHQIVDIVHKVFMPRTVVLLHTGDPQDTALEKINPSVQFQKPIRGKPAVYLCENFTCGKPLTDLSDVHLAIKSASNEPI